MEAEDKSANALSNEQLLEYIKKQKAKIKKLEKDKETLGKINVEQEQQIIAATAAAAAAAVSTAGTTSPSHSSSDNPSLFWGLIDRESSFKQKLAKIALNSFVATIEKSSLGKKYVPSRRSLFDHWKEHTYFMKMTAIATELLESSKSYLALEQKTAKLKALLARTHQSNQRFQEDTTSFKKIQKDAELQLKSLKERDESEREALLETVRARTIETAFQYDMELAIQRAADGDILFLFIIHIYHLYLLFIFIVYIHCLYLFFLLIIHIYHLYVFLIHIFYHFCFSLSFTCAIYLYWICVIYIYYLCSHSICRHYYR